MATNYSSKSPYSSTPITKGYLDVLTIRQITPMTDDVVYEVTLKYENRPDLLAYDLYGDSALWWVFAVRNKNTIKDPIYDLVAGTKIYIPRLSTLKTNLGI